MALNTQPCFPWNILLFCYFVFSSLFSAVTADWCSSYYDIWGNYQSGFGCPTWINSWDQTYCCGSDSYKYCCSNSFLAIDDGSYYYDWDGDDITHAVALGIYTIIGIIFGVIALLVFIVVVISLICCKLGGTTTRTRGRTTVVHNNAVAPMITTSHVTTMNHQSSMYPQPPPTYNQSYGYPPPPPPPPYQSERTQVGVITNGGHGGGGGWY